MRPPTAVRQSIRLGGRTTTVTLENAFWLGLKEIAHRRRMKVPDLVREIGAKRQHSNFSSELRLFVLEFYRKQASLPDQRATAGGVLSNLKVTRFERREVIARPLLGRRTGKDRHVATAVIVKILNTPLTRTVAIFVNRHLSVERTDRGISEVLAARETRYLGWVLGSDNLFERSWPRSTHRQPTPHLLRMFRAPHSSSASRFTAGACGFLDFSQSGDRPDL